MKQTKGFESNELIDRLPPHLKQFIKPQNYEEYTPVNQAVWRYVMRKNVEYLSKTAHASYINGLKHMNRILKEIGWAAVAVDGFIPPNAFMEFQAYKVLVIASDILRIFANSNTSNIHLHLTLFTNRQDMHRLLPTLIMQNICVDWELLGQRRLCRNMIWICMRRCENCRF